MTPTELLRQYVEKFGTRVLAQQLVDVSSTMKFNVLRHLPRSIVDEIEAKIDEMESYLQQHQDLFLLAPWNDYQLFHDRQHYSKHPSRWDIPPYYNPPQLIDDKYVTHFHELLPIVKLYILQTAYHDKNMMAQITDSSQPHYTNEVLDLAVFADIKKAKEVLLNKDYGASFYASWLFHNMNIWS